MSYRIYKFGSTELPSTRLTGTFGTGPSLETAIASVGGMHDTQGDGYASLRLPHEIVYSCWIVDTAANTHAKLAAWQAQRGVLAKLYRLNEYDSTEHWCYARLMQVRAPWQYQRKTMQPLELLFYVMSPWYEDICAGAWYLDDGKYLDAGLFLDGTCAEQIDLTNNLTVTGLTIGGNAPTSYISVAFTARTNPITQLTILIDTGVNVCAVQWTGTLAVNKTLVIDSRNQRVTNDGAQDHGTTIREMTVHTSNYWFEFAPGYNTITLARTGGDASCTADFSYSYCWS